MMGHKQQEARGYYTPSTFVARYVGDPKVDDDFCSACMSLRSTHVTVEGDPVLRCPLTTKTSYVRGGKFAYWLRDTPLQAQFADDPKIVADLVRAEKVTKVLAYSGERMTYVEPTRPEITLTYAETQLILSMLNKQSLNIASLAPEPDLFKGLTPDELGTLLGKLAATP